jgi:hypothetical protein
MVSQIDDHWQGVLDELCLAGAWGAYEGEREPRCRCDDERLLRFGAIEDCVFERAAAVAPPRRAASSRLRTSLIAELVTGAESNPPMGVGASLADPVVAPWQLVAGAEA